jgi:hypothetical protein
MSVTTLLSSSARTAATGSGTATAITASSAYVFVLDVTAAATDSGDKLDVYIQTKPDGTNWTDVGRFTQCDGNGGTKRYVGTTGTALSQSEFETGTALTEGAWRNIFGTEWRARWVITDAGTDNASFTFSVTALPLSG